MKKILFGIFLFACLIGHGQTIIGTGSGTVALTGVTGGNYIIKPGTYSSGKFTNLSDVTIVNGPGLVTFTGGVTIGGWKNVSFSGTGQSGLTYGFQFSGAKGTLFPFGGGQLYHSGIYNVEALSCGDMFSYSNNEGGTYTGDSSTLMVNMLTLQNIHMSNSGQLWYGTWDALSTGHSVVYGLQVYGLKVENLQSAGYLVWGNSLYGVDFSDWTLTGTNPKSTGDVGLISGAGSGKFHSIYINGLRGYLTRWQSAKLNGVGDTRIYNNIKANTPCYGLVDARDESATYGGKATPGEFWICNNTQVNNADCFGGAYTTAAAAIFNHPGITFYVYNNLNLACQGSQTNGIYNDGNGAPLVQATNLQASSAAGIVDPTTGNLVTNSTAIGKGTKLSWLTEDFYHHPVPATPALGAVQPTTGTTPPPPVNVPPIAEVVPVAAITLPINSITLDASGSMDSDGTISAYAWSFISGPVTPAIVSPTVAKTSVSGLLLPGTYVFALKVTDNAGAAVAGSLSVTVNPAVQSCPPPIVCPVCPTIPPARKVKSVTVTYDDGTTVSQLFP